MIIQIEPWIGKEELSQLERMIDSTFVTESMLTKEFEDLTKEMTSSKYAIAMTNGTAALFCGLKALGIGPGDEVIVPDMTFIASANAVILAGATPVLCDIYSDTLCIDVEKAEELINEKTKAIMPVHLYGQSCDMEKIDILAKKNDVFIIEDAAQGVGVHFNNSHVGIFGDVGILSYYGNKTITCGEGGVVLTNNQEIAEKCYMLKNHGRSQKGIFLHESIGFNFAFTEMQAAIGIAQMHKLKKIISRKLEINNLYQKELGFISDLIPIQIDKRCDPVYWFTSFLTEKNEDLTKYLKKKGIQTRKFFYPLHRQPCYNDNNLVKFTNCPNSVKAYQMGISLPSSYNLSKANQDKVISEIISFFK